MQTLATNMVSDNFDLQCAAHTSREGPIMRIGPNDLMTTSPELLTHMSAVRSPYTRSAWFYGASRVEPGKDHVFSQVDEAKHTKRRQQMAAGVSYSPLPFLISNFTVPVFRQR
jgi:hypothetical protein